MNPNLYQASLFEQPIDSRTEAIVLPFAEDLQKSAQWLRTGL